MKRLTQTKNETRALRIIRTLATCPPPIYGDNGKPLWISPYTLNRLIRLIRQSRDLFPQARERRA